MIVLVGKQRIFSSCPRVALPGDTGETLVVAAARAFHPSFPRIAAARGDAGEARACPRDGGGGDPLRLRSLASRREIRYDGPLRRRRGVALGLPSPDPVRGGAVLVVRG